ncbi:MAG TPA: chemotaxis protein CheA [Steroidobacteraceae bacterium]|jgi:two-component system chemotaxis sensor kinase CheA|nr:chemotaxis protein CheA [Steroidobacteraceae bacterium]
MNDFLRQFLIESRELVVQATEGLLLLEKSPHDADRLDTVFRAFHTLKGGAGIVAFAMMERALHSAESLLMDARSGKLSLNPALVGDCLTSLDQVSQWLDTLEQTGELPTSIGKPSAAQAPPDWATILVGRHPGATARAATAFRFTPDRDCFYKGEDPIARVSSLPQLLALEIEPASPWPPLDKFDPYTCNIVLAGLTGTSGGEVGAQLRSLSGECEVRTLKSAEAPATPVLIPEMVRKVLQEQLALLDVKEPLGAAGRIASVGLTAANAMRFCGLDAHAENFARAAQQSSTHGSPDLRDAIAQLLRAQSLAPAPARAPAPASGATGAPGEPVAPLRTETSARTLRINAEQIDALVRLTGELTVAKNALGHTAKLAQANGDSSAALLKEHHGVLTRLISQLQSSVIGMRVLPLRSVFQRFPRVLREMSANLGKPTELIMEGEDTEADKTIVEMLFEPLLHIVRNALDHGVESSEQRRAAGKPAVARILLRAARDGDQVLIAVADDGAGIEVERIRQVASDRGMASREDLKDMADSDIIDLVFAPGFSTAAHVTELSGRGVGMDAVRTAVERVGGRVSIASRFKAGTTVSFSLPFSVMMTQVMTVEAGGQMFGIPLDAVVETVSAGKEAFSGVGEARVIVHRNRTIPVIELEGVLNAAPERRQRTETDATIIIAAVNGQLVGLQVDRPGERMEIILKPLDGLLSGTPGIAGTTVLGDGRVLLVLDIIGILQ